MIAKIIDIPFLRKTAHAVAIAGLIIGGSYRPVFAATTPSPIPLSNLPMVMVQPTHAQVLFLVGNSQSMDGNLSGAIMTGASGSYTVPSGFTAPVSGTVGDGSTTANYTKACGSYQCDNSDSRLNVAKAAIAATINQYASVTDFGLMDFETGSVGRYTTWVYYMSKTGGFTFTDTAGTDTVANPCYQSNSNACYYVASHYGNSDATTMKYMVIDKSSDDPAINDVLYAGNSLPADFVTYNGPYKGYNWSDPVTNPYPPVYSLSDYNNGNILLGYRYGTDGTSGFATGPTNAGYVPYSDEVFYAQRGFGYYANPSNRGQLLVQIGQNTASTFTSYLAPETNSTNSSEIKATAVNATLASLLREADWYYNGTHSYTAPTTNTGCSTHRYVILVTDGLPTVDLSGKSWPPLGSESATGYGVTATIDSTDNPPRLAYTTTNYTNDTAVSDAITQIQQLESDGITTYVVGMGAGVDASKNPSAAATLEAMALAGSGGKTNYFPATTPADVASQLEVILSQIQSAQLATASAATNSTSLNTVTQLFQARFDSTNWTGNLYDFKFDSSTNSFYSDITNSSDYYWDAQSKLDAQANDGSGRSIVTWNPSTGTGVPFEWDSSNPSQSISSTQHDDLAEATDPTTTSSVDWALDRLNYLRGDTSNDGTGDNFRDRNGILLGDIVDSNPLFVGPPDGPYPDTSYLTFEKNEEDRTPVIYVGANDGMLHAFNANINAPTNMGKEIFAYVPNGVFPNLKYLTDTDYATTHRFYVDGAPTSGDVQFSDATWHTLLVGGLNNGGNSVYALDVTDIPATQSSLTETQAAQKVLWEFTDSDMGQSYSQPQITRVAATDSAGNNFLVVFGSGYNNSSQTPFLYFLDAQTGAVVDKIDLCSKVANACDSSQPNGLAGVTVFDPVGNGVGTVVYAGDLQGHLWKVDISSSNINQWKTSLLFSAVDASGNPQPITTAPVVSLHPLYPSKNGYLVMFGTGRFLGADDLPSTTTTPQTQSFYGIWDNLAGTQPTRSQLQQQSYVEETYTPQSGTTKTVREFTYNSVNWNTQYGWYIDFDTPSNSGERVIDNPTLAAGMVIFDTYTPSTDTCDGGGTGWLMILNYSTGGAFLQPTMDLNGDGVINAGDQAPQVTGYSQNPGGLSFNGKISISPVMEGTGTDSSSGINHTLAIPVCNAITGKCSLIMTTAPGFGRLSWRELQ